MKELEFTVQDIKDIMESFSRQGLGKLRIQQGEFCLKLEGASTALPMVAAAPAAPAAAVTPGEAPAPAEEALPGQVVTSPIVGTFYAAPGPDKDPFVKVGQQVGKGDVLFIIESMKLMNEVTSEHSGTVTRILVENAQGVEYGQPILCIE